MTLDEAMTRALGGDAGDLYALLSKNSGLPGERANLVFAKVVAQACAADARGAALSEKMARISADEAPGGSPLEFIPLCGVLGAGACAARQPKTRDAMLRVIHDACDDLRFRVRDAAPEALAQLGAREGAALLADVGNFVDGYHHAAVLLEALVRPEWLPLITDAEPVVSIVSRAFDSRRRRAARSVALPGIQSARRVARALHRAARAPIRRAHARGHRELREIARPASARNGRARARGQKAPRALPGRIARRDGCARGCEEAAAGSAEFAARDQGSGEGEGVISPPANMLGSPSDAEYVHSARI